MSLPVKEPIVNLAQWARREYDLKDAWTFVEAAHTPDLQYHNLTHIEIVTGAAVLLALHEGFNPKVAAIAAMFHDCGHTGTQPDAPNIEQALMWFDVWSQRVAHPLSAFGTPTVSEENVALIKQAIKCTEYRDGAFPNQPVTVLDRILRDADVWNPHLASENCAFMSRGLAREMMVTLSPEQFFTKQIMFFVKDIEWHTKYGQQLSSRVHERLNSALFPDVEYGALRPDRSDDE